MSRQANPAAIGGFVLGALTLVVIGILVFSSGALFRERIPMLTYFPGSVQGLSVGAQVQLEGVPIGQVTRIGLEFLPDRGTFRIPVHYEVWRDDARILGADGGQDPRQVLRRLVEEKGLRARLEYSSFVTGQYLVGLGLYPSRPAAEHAEVPPGTVYIPAIAATRDRLQEMLENLRLDQLMDSALDTLEAIRQVAESPALASAIGNLAEALAEVKTLAASLNRALPPLAQDAREALARVGGLAETLTPKVEALSETLTLAIGDVARLARGLEGQVAPLATAARAALDEAGGAMSALAELTGKASTTRHQLDRLLQEAARAAQSLRTLADYLERHPEALLKGKH